MKIKRKLFFFLFFTLLYVPNSIAQTAGASITGIPGNHRGAVTAIVFDERGRILSAGEDGFLGIWNSHAAVERFQLSPYRITSMVLRPGRPEIAIIENDGLSIYRISAWNYETNEKLFSRRFRDPIAYINYSAAGSFLIAAHSGHASPVFIHPETGDLLESPQGLSGRITFAATGRTERVMICYLLSGSLLYWDLDAGTLLQQLTVPPNIQGPVLFGNNRFLGGFDSRGLVILDAVTGIVLARNESIRRGKIFVDSADSLGQRSPGQVRFYCLSSTGVSNTIYRMEINLSGYLTILSQRTVSTEAELSFISGAGGNMVLGTTEGNLWFIDRDGERLLETQSPRRITGIAASSSLIGFISEKSEAGFIPLDFSLLANEDTLYLGNASNFTRLTSRHLEVPDKLDAENHFLFWHSINSIPKIKTPGYNDDAGSGTETGSYLLLNNLPMRFPIRSAAIMGSSVLFLNTAGMITILNSENGDIRFSFSATGAQDAALIDENTLILARTTVRGAHTPFMTININTGETVPLPYPALTGIRVYKGSSGVIYAALVDHFGGITQTSIIRLDTGNPANSEKIFVYQGEDSTFVMAESAGNLASNLGGRGAILFPRGQTGEHIHFERSAGLPLKIINGGRWFITLDGEGGITWHDNNTGKLQAVFRLHQDSWVLEKAAFPMPGLGTVWHRLSGPVQTTSSP